MKSYDKLWNNAKKYIAIKCENKDSRLFYDNLQEMYFVVKKYADGSVLHTKETLLFESHNISEVNAFINSYHP